MTRGHLLQISSVAAVVALAVATPAKADWLITHDGARLQTKGPWQVKGKQIVFTQTTGQLGTLRVSEVDLDASAKATAEAASPAAAAEAAATEKKKSVLVLTDKDVGHVDGAGAAPAAEGEGGAEASKDAPAALGGVLVDTWEKVETADRSGIEIFGAIKNTGKDTATDITLVVKIFDEGGALLATVDATLSSSVLQANGTTNFRATFPGVIGFASARFEVKNRTLMSKPAAAGASAG